ncbi:MAG: hypothetical protein IJZ39_10305 [Oscillospiraceae bacterium]|nr:hypothetical protein [Oscillospiraceae bacterium]
MNNLIDSNYNEKAGKVKREIHETAVKRYSCGLCAKATIFVCVKDKNKRKGNKKS